MVDFLAAEVPDVDSKCLVVRLREVPTDYIDPFSRWFGLVGSEPRVKPADKIYILLETNNVPYSNPPSFKRTANRRAPKRSVRVGLHFPSSRNWLAPSSIGAGFRGKQAASSGLTGER
jgi:hypothetical protein